MSYHNTLFFSPLFSKMYLTLVEGTDVDEKKIDVTGNGRWDGRKGGRKKGSKISQGKGERRGKRRDGAKVTGFLFD